jgi:stage IV sporulation protein FB
MKIKGIRFRLSFLFALTVAFLIGSGAGESFFITIISALLHEAAHLFCLISYDAPPTEIIIGAAGFRMTKSSKLLSYRQEIVTSLAGVVVNFGIAALMFLLYIYTGRDERLLMPVYANLGLGIINILPIEPLDGGKALYFYLCHRTTEAAARRITERISLAFIIPLFFASFFILIKSGYNLTLICVTIYLGISLISRANNNR